MSVTYGELTSFNPNTWTSQADKWAINAVQSTTAATDLEARAVAVRQQWSGPVGDAIASALEDRAETLREHASVYREIRDALNDGAKVLAALQKEAEAIVTKAESMQLEVNWQGEAGLSDAARQLPFFPDQVRLIAVAGAVNRQIRIKLFRATIEDIRVAAALAKRADIDWPIPSDVGPIDLSDNAIRLQLMFSSQGALGDCVWLATLRAVANANPETIRQNCVWDPDSQTYKVTIYHPETGEPQVVTVDPDSLADASRDAQDPDKVNFLMIYEQALLQVDPTFDSTNFPEATKMILGRDLTETTAADTPTSEIRDKHEKDPPGAAMVATSGADPQPADVPEDKRMVPGHAYQVVSVDAQGNITLANPWGPDGGRIGKDFYPGTVTLTPEEYSRWCNGVMQVDNP